MRNINLSAKVYQDIKYMLMTLHFPPGTLLREQTVAEALGVSRTPVREAFQRLAQEGWLQIGEGRRAVVSPVTIIDVDNIFSLRMLLESYAVEETFCGKKSRRLAGELDQALSAMCEQDLDRVAFAQLDMKFHSLLMKNVENERLSRFWKTLHEESSRLAIMTLPDHSAQEVPDRTELVMQEHAAILDSLWKKDRAAALSALNEHLVNSRNALFYKMDAPVDKIDEMHPPENILDFKKALSIAK